MGAQGAGKGTQAERIAPRFELAHLSTGELFRNAIAAGTELGVLAKQYLDRGELVPDDVTIGLVDRKLAAIADAHAAGNPIGGALFDGFPRTLGQATGLDALLSRRCETIDAVIEIDVPLEVLIVRLAGRRVCPGCGATFHIEFDPPATSDVCDRCGSALVQRADDTPEAINRRLELYFQQTKPLLDYYRERGLLRRVDGNREIDAVTRAISREIPRKTASEAR